MSPLSPLTDFTRNESKSMRAFLGMLLFLIGLAAVFLWSGIYSVAAVKPHSDIVIWLLTTARDKSIAQHSGHIQPPALTDPALVQTGFQEYHSMCVACHGAPGQEASEISKGLNPKPPQLTTPAVQARGNVELFWIIKNGLRMTGMPAFGPTHDDPILWSLVAFLRRLCRNFSLA